MTTQRRSRFRQVVLNHLLQVKARLLLAALCALGFILTGLLTPWPLKIIFDHVLLDKPVPASLAFLGGMLQSGKIHALVAISLAVLVIALLRGLFSYAQLSITSRAGYQMVYALRKELFGHLQRLSLSFHNRARCGELLTQVTGDTNILKDTFTDSALAFTADLLTMIGMFGIMFVLSWKLGLLVLAPLPLLVSMCSRIRSCSARRSGETSLMESRMPPRRRSLQPRKRPGLRTRLGQSARATVVREHTWDAVARRILGLADSKSEPKSQPRTVESII